jgi:hypothetical protein
MGNRCFPFDARIRLELVSKEFNLVMHDSVGVLLIGCMMGMFFRMLHGERCVPGKVLTRSNKGIDS